MHRFMSHLDDLAGIDMHLTRSARPSAMTVAGRWGTLFRSKAAQVDQAMLGACVPVAGSPSSTAASGVHAPCTSQSAC